MFLSFYQLKAMATELPEVWGSYLKPYSTATCVTRKQRMMKRVQWVGLVETN